MASTVTPVRRSPSGDLLADVDVTGWTLWRSIDDLPAPDAFGVRDVEPGGYMLVNDIEIPGDQQIRLVNTEAPLTTRPHRIIGNGSGLWCQQAGALPIGPFLRIYDTALDVAFFGVRFVGRASAPGLVLVDNEETCPCLFSGCQFETGNYLVRLIGPGSRATAQFQGCSFRGGTIGIHHLGQWCSVVGSIFQANTDGILCDTAGAKLRVSESEFYQANYGVRVANAYSMDAIGCRFASMADGVRLAGLSTRATIVGGTFDSMVYGVNVLAAQSVDVSGVGFSSMTDAVELAGGIAASVHVRGCDFRNLGNGILVTGATPTGGVVILGNTGGAMGPLTNLAAADPACYRRGNIIGGVKQSESAITP